MARTFYLVEYDSRVRVNEYTHFAPDIEVSGGYYGDSISLDGYNTLAEAQAEAERLRAAQPKRVPVTILQITVMEVR